MIGTKLAHYEITSHLGTGGMGEVYQATDSKLGRSIAIKLLPEAFTHDRDRASRFEREARLLASLNHSNIATIYGVEESGGRKFLVMELVPGETLAERIKRGPLPVDEALKIAVQIAEALEAAHEKGVMHRDLKPANIKVTPNGQVKVLDFGLAKAFAGEAAVVDSLNSPTISMSVEAATNAGVILGTAAYMSPEQAKGQAVDHRTDIFAFGCVLYEMLTGRQTFPDEGVSDILASVLKSEPDWNRLPNDTPAAVRRVLRRCLRKDRNRRLQTIGDARIEIEEAGAEPETVVRPQRREVLKWIGAGAGGAVAGALGASYFRNPTQASETRVLDLALPPTPDPMSFALSPDGSSLVFVASGDKQPQLWLRSLNTGLQQPLAGTEGATFPFWKPDSQAVAFVADYKLKRIDIGGGAPQTLVASVLTYRGGAWGPNGVILFTPNGSAPLFRVSDSPGGTAVAVTNLEPDHSSHRFPYFLPGGRQFLFYVWGSAKHQGIYLGSLDSTKIQLLVLSVSAGAYLPSGWLLFVRSETLVAQRFDSANGKLSGGEVRIGAPVGADGGTGYGAFSVSATGLVAYRAKIAGERQLMWFDKKETMLGTFGSRDENNMANPAISPDGLRVAVDRVVQGNQDVWILDPNPQQFTTNKDVDSYPVWSPGGRWIMFRSNRTSAFDLYLKPTKDEIDETLLVESPELKVPNDWNGQYILYYKVNRPTGFRSLWLLPIIEDGKPGESRAFQSHDRDEFNGKFSPDGQFVAYQSNETPGREINVVRLLGKARPLQVSKGGGIWPQWSPDRNELYYLRLDGMLMAVSLIEKGAELERGDEQELFRPRIVSDNVSPLWQYDVARKGEHRGHFLINVEGAVTSPITLVLNWKPPSN